MLCKLEKTGENTRINFGGEFTIFNAREAWETLREAFREPGPVKVAIAEVSEADMCCPQLLCAAHRTAVKEGRGFAVEGEIPSCVRSLLETVGWEHHISCPTEGIKTCVFEGGARG